MHSSLIGKIEKAKRYSEERSRVTISQFSASFQGEHDTHALAFEGDRWHCSCHYFANHQICSHTMALDRMLAGMLPKTALVSFS